MYCSKCGTQLNDGTPVCNSCGCPTEFYNKTTTLRKTCNHMKLSILLVIIPACSILSFLAIKAISTYDGSLSDFIYRIPDLLCALQYILILIFSGMNLKLKSRLFKVAAIILAIASVLLLANNIQWMQEYSEDIYYLNIQIRYSLYMSVLFAGIGLLLISTNNIGTLTTLQKKARIIGSILSFAYIPWLLFIQLPWIAVESFVMELGDGLLFSFVLKFYGTYQPFIPLLESDVIQLVGAIFFTIIAVVFYNIQEANSPN